MNPTRNPLFFELNKEQIKKILELFKEAKVNEDNSYYEEPEKIIGIELDVDGWDLWWKKSNGLYYVNCLEVINSKLYKCTLQIGKLYKGE